MEVFTLDHVVAFVNAPIDKEVYVKFPAGAVTSDGTSLTGQIIKLRKTLYGLVQAPLNLQGNCWYIDNGFTVPAVQS